AVDLALDDWPETLGVFECVAIVEERSVDHEAGECQAQNAVSDAEIAHGATSRVISLSSAWMMAFPSQFIKTVRGTQEIGRAGQDETNQRRQCLSCPVALGWQG